MRNSRIAAMVFAGAGVLAVIGSLSADAAARCHGVDATIKDRIVTEGCPPPSQACVVGTVNGNHGFNGTTVFVLGSRAEAPATSPGYRAVSGTFTITFDDGSTLTALETSIGNVDVTTGAGHAGGTQEFIAGTGRYQGATGFSYLMQRFEDGQFVTQIHGEVCRPRR